MPAASRLTAPELWRLDDGSVTHWRDVGFDANWATHVMSFDATGTKLS